MIKDIVKNLKHSSTLKINEISKKLEAEGKLFYTKNYYYPKWDTSCKAS